MRPYVKSLGPRVKTETNTVCVEQFHIAGLASLVQVKRARSDDFVCPRCILIIIINAIVVKLRAIPREFRIP